VLVMPEWYPWPDRPVFGTFCREQARAAARAHDVVVVTWRAEDGVAGLFSVHESEEAGVPTYRIGFRRSAVPKLGFVAKMLGILTVLARLRRHGAWTPDVVHAHEYEAGLPATVVAAMTRAAVVITEHASNVALGRLEPVQRAAARRAFARADAVCPVSDDLGRRLADLAGATPLMPVPNAVDDELFRLRPAAARSSVRLLTVGNLVEIKGHRHLIGALARLHDRGVPARLEIVGDGTLRGALEGQVRELGLESHVQFHGYLSREGVAEMMGTVDVFVLPSLWETLGCVLIEAMASGLPSVATDVGGVPEVLDPRAGVLVAPESPEALAVGIAEVLDRIGDYSPQELRALAVDRYGYAAVGRRWSTVYRSVLAVRRPSCSP